MSIFICVYVSGDLALYTPHLKPNSWTPAIFPGMRKVVSAIAVITVEPADKISFVYNCMKTRLRGQYNGK